MKRMYFGRLDYELEEIIRKVTVDEIEDGVVYRVVSEVFRKNSISPFTSDTKWIINRDKAIEMAVEFVRSPT
jgi:hypothetical protein